MKAVAAILLLALVATCAFGREDLQTLQDMKDFMQFKITYGRSYDSMKENLYRFKIFQENMRQAEKLNVENPLARFGMTQFSDMTPEEFRSSHLMNLKKPTDLPIPAPNVPPPVLNPGPIPTYYDWRSSYSKDCITPVYNQGQCGSCWAFSCTEEIESMWCLAGNTLTQLSMQQVVSCDTTCDGCNGGWPYLCYGYVEGADGLEPYSDYPYTSAEGNTGYCKYDKAEVFADIAAWQWVSHLPAINESNMFAVSWASGPLSICVDASTWSSYQSGIITKCGTAIDHCVQLTGWNTQGATPYWIVRNSWGVTWGLQGYLYVESGKNMCGIAEYATIVTI